MIILNKKCYIKRVAGVLISVSMLTLGYGMLEQHQQVFAGGPEDGGPPDEGNSNDTVQNSATGPGRGNLPVPILNTALNPNFNLSQGGQNQAEPNLMILPPMNFQMAEITANLGNANQGTAKDNTDSQTFLPSRKEKYGKGNEAKAIKEALGDFDVYNSRAYKEVVKNYGKSLRMNELLEIINSLTIYLRDKKGIILPKLTRNDKRSFPLLIKYVETNFDTIQPWLGHVHLCDSNFKRIPTD